MFYWNFLESVWSIYIKHCSSIQVPFMGERIFLKFYWYFHYMMIGYSLKSPFAGWMNIWCMIVAWVFIFAPRLAFGSLSNGLIMIFPLKKERVVSFGIPEASSHLQTCEPDDSAVCANCWFNQMQYIFFSLYRYWCLHIKLGITVAVLIFQGDHCQYCVFIYFIGMDWWTISIWTLFVYGNYLVSRNGFWIYVTEQLWTRQQLEIL